MRLITESKDEILSTTSDESAIQATLQGDQDAFGLLVTRYEQRLLDSVINRIGCGVAAEDIVQDAFLRAFKSLSSFRGGSQFYTWLYRIAINSYLSQVRQRGEVTSLIGSPEMPEPQDTRTCDFPPLWVERREACSEVTAAIARLPKRKQHVLYLREIKGLDYQSIADELGIQVGTVKSRLSRARESLREQLEDYMCVESDAPA